jgi:hypothetical protein
MSRAVVIGDVRREWNRLGKKLPGRSGFCRQPEGWRTWQDAPQVFMNRQFRGWRRNLALGLQKPMLSPNSVLRGAKVKRGVLVAALVVVSFAASAALGKNEPSYEHGKLLHMEATQCGYSENGGKGVAGALLGTDSEHKKTEELLCQEYVLESDRVTYRIRPKDAKHPVLLPLGEGVEFRIHKDKMLLRVPEGDDKEREYLVVSMSLREGAKESKPVASKTSPQ